MSQQEFFATVIQILNDLNIPYMLTGSNASSFYGEPRSTHDIDFVVAIALADATRLAQSFDRTRYYLDEEAVREAIRRRDMFNLIDSYTGLKADFWFLRADAYHQICFNRRRKYTIFGHDTYIATPEDVILTKLEWYKLSGGSEMQFRDALGVYEVQADNLDMEYIYEWAEHLEIRSLLDKVIEESAL